MKITKDIFEYNFITTPTPLMECPGITLCSECSFSDQQGGFCTGCDGYKKRCLKRVCAFTSCGTCSGGRHAKVKGCCGRAPELWREQMYQLLNYEVPDYSPARPDINCRLIPVVYPQIKIYRIPEQFKKIDSWIVPIHKVANRKGDFRSNDLKDFVGLSPNKKLILSTCAPDDYQEMLWEKGGEIDYEKYGINYWFPGHFSIYDNDSKLYQFISAKRQQLHAIWTKSQFVWFRLGENIPIQFLKPIQNASSVLISKNQMFSKRNHAILHKEVQAADEWFKLKTSFFVMGDHRSLPISENRICYQIESKWLIRGLKGYDMEGKKVKKEVMSIKEILVKNLEDAYEILYSTII